MSENLRPNETEPECVVVIESNGPKPARGLRRVGDTIMSCYTPKPMSEPVMPADIDDLSAIAAVTEVCRWACAWVLYTLSPRGGLQAWWRLWLIILSGIFPVVLALWCIGMGVMYVLVPIELASLTLQRVALNIGIVAVIAASVTLLFSLCVVALKGVGVIAKSTFITGTFAVIVLAILLIAGIACGIVWLESRFPGVFDWLKWIGSWFASA